jgi:hypothetical protein
MHVMERRSIIDFLDWHYIGDFEAPPVDADLFEASSGDHLAEHEKKRFALRSKLFALTPDQLCKARDKAFNEQEQARPFHKPWADADFEHYGRCNFLTSEEAAALALGKHPVFVNWGTVQPFIDVSPFANLYARLLDLIDRAIAWGELSKYFSPFNFLEWANKYKIAVPSRFIECTFDRGETLRTWHDAYQIANEQLVVALADREQDRSDNEALLNALLASEARCRSLESTLAGLKSKQDDGTNARAAVTQHAAQITELKQGLAKAEASLKSPPAKSQRSFQIIMLTLANWKANYRGPNGHAASDIADAAARLGLRITKQVVSSHLRDAAEALDVDLSPGG